MRPNVVFLIIDSFRADKFYGKDKTSITPNFDTLIKNGTFFSQAISSADATLLSWSSIYTGLYPFKTGIRSTRFNKLSNNVTTIFDLLKKYNYKLYSFTPTFSETVGLFPNFSNENSMYDFTQTLHTGLGTKILSQLNSNTMTSPWFLNIHLMDLHEPFLVPTNFKNEKFGFSKYEKIVSSIDNWIGNLIEKIDFENTILIITSDHGQIIRKIKKNSEIIDYENDGEKDVQKKKFTNKTPKIFKPLKDKIFFSLESKKQTKKLSELSHFSLSPYERRSLLPGSFTIDHDLYDEKLKVPLLFVGKNIPKNRIFSKQVKLIDIFPTLCYLLDFDFNYNAIDGKNLFPLKNEEVFEESPVYIESTPLIEKNSNDVIGIRTPNFKYFRDSNFPNQRLHLFDLINDPFEEINITEKNPDQIAKLEQNLQDILNNSEKSVPQSNDLSSDEIENELRKMGYV